MGRPKSDDPKVQVGMRIPTRTVAVIDAWGAEHEWDRSEAMRRVMQAGYEALGLNKRKVTQ